MALTPGTDTYGTVSEADDYFAIKIGAELWAPLTNEQKEAALQWGRLHLDHMFEWKGQISDDSQLLSWPRQNVYDNEGRQVPVDAFPLSIKQSQFELAYQWAFADQLTPDPTYLTFSDANLGREIKREKLEGVGEKEYFQADGYLADLTNGRMKTKVYPLVLMLCKPYCTRVQGSIFVEVYR